MAKQHRRAPEWSDGEWFVYELAGDFTLDTHLVAGRRHINKTLRVVRRIEPHPADLQ